MRLLFTGLLCTCLALTGRAQERVRNVRVRVVDSSQLDIRYDLINARPGDSIYLDVKSRLRGSLRISPEFVRGDIGKRVTAGSDRRIIWDALANGYALNEEIRATVFVKTGLPPAPPSSQPAVAQQPEPPSAESTQQPKPDQRPKPASEPTVPANPKANEAVTDNGKVPRPTTPTKPKPALQPAETNPAGASVGESVQARPIRYAGPAWALLSVVAPGVGNIFVQQPKPKIGFRPLLTIGCYGLVAYGLMERQKSRDAYAIYQQQKNLAAGEPYYQTANDHHHRYYLATRGALVVAAADVILTFFKGLRNDQLRHEARRFQGLTVQPGLQVGQPTAVVRYSF